MKEFTILKNEEGINLKAYINRKIEANKTFFIIAKRKKLIKVNGHHPVDYDLYLKEGDVVSVYLNDSYFKEVNIKPNFDKSEPHTHLFICE